MSINIKKIGSEIGDSDVLLYENGGIINKNHEVLDNRFAQMVYDLLKCRGEHE